MIENKISTYIDVIFTIRNLVFVNLSFWEE